jgi:hypothetical protein
MVAAAKMMLVVGGKRLKPVSSRGLVFGASGWQ